MRELILLQAEILLYGALLIELMVNALQHVVDLRLQHPVSVRPDVGAHLIGSVQGEKVESPRPAQDGEGDVNKQQRVAEKTLHSVLLFLRSHINTRKHESKKQKIQGRPGLPRKSYSSGLLLPCALKPRKAPQHRNSDSDKEKYEGEQPGADARYQVLPREIYGVARLNIGI